MHKFLTVNIHHPEFLRLSIGFDWQIMACGFIEVCVLANGWNIIDVLVGRRDRMDV
jgi:hypothetical protein